MPSHKRSQDVMLDAKEVIQVCLREGYFPPAFSAKGRGAHTEAASRLAEKYGVPTSTAWKWVSSVANDDEFKPDYSLFRPYQYQSIREVKPVAKPEGNGKRLAIIGDAHDSPALPDKSRFEWMGRWAIESGADEVWQIGDFVTLDSLTRHAAPGTKGFADLPSFKDDLDSLEQALEAFERGTKGLPIPKVLTLGNHENRAYAYEDKSPQMSGTVVPLLHQKFEDYGWRLVPYGEIAFVEGVGLSHCAIGMTGKAYGGKTADQRTGNDSTFSFIHGHTHARVMAPSPKIGPLGHVDIVSVGCSLPWGYIEEYATHGPSGWWWGVSTATLMSGSIIDMSFTSMLELERDYA